VGGLPRAPKSRGFHKIACEILREPFFKGQASSFLVLRVYQVGAKIKAETSAGRAGAAWGPSFSEFWERDTG
jgi:hypothetical protein